MSSGKKSSYIWHRNYMQFPEQARVSRPNQHNWKLCRAFLLYSISMVFVDCNEHDDTDCNTVKTTRMEIVFTNHKKVQKWGYIALSVVLEF